MNDTIISSQTLRDTVIEAVQSQAVTDIHTHLFTPAFGDLLLWGVDELLTYHYLIAETFRCAPIACDKFWSMDRRERADLIWRTLFIENSPISEACRGVVTTLNALGLDVKSRDLQSYRDYFAGMQVEDYIDKVFELTKITEVVMTNDPFDPAERPVWLSEVNGDPRFHAALRLDVLLNSYRETGCEQLSAFGYQVDYSLSELAVREIRRFLDEWINRMQPKYMAVSLPPEFQFPEDSVRSKIIQACILPVSREFNLPFALMIGVKRAVNPQLQLAGDGMGKADLTSLVNLLRENTDNKFLVTLLSRENQHELCVLGRKFRNLMIFGCWWFVNNPSIIDEITRERIELLGLSFIPQHSDARILDQLIYKWKHSRQIIANSLAEKYQGVLDSGWRVTKEEIQRDVAALFGGNFHQFVDGD